MAVRRLSGSFLLTHEYVELFSYSEVKTCWYFYQALIKGCDNDSFSVRLFLILIFFLSWCQHHVSLSLSTLISFKIKKELWHSLIFFFGHNRAILILTFWQLCADPTSHRPYQDSWLSPSVLLSLFFLRGRFFQWVLLALQHFTIRIWCFCHLLASWVCNEFQGANRYLMDRERTALLYFL